MRALIDADILNYEIGFSSQKLNEEGELEISSWDWTQELLDHRIKLICEEAGADEPPLMFLTNSHSLNRQLNKERKRENLPTVSYVENFRVEAAKEKVYKGTRKSDKPFHFKNIIAYIRATYDCHINESGLEADDAICITQYTRWKQGLKDTIIASRDKDLRQCPGWAYSWEIGKQAAIGPIEVTELGYLTLINPKKVFGVGDLFFYYQMIVGDAVDNIPGLKGKGPVFGYNLLKDVTSSREAYELVAEKYVQGFGDLWKEKMKEMSKLLWMIREIDEKGEKVLWKPPPRLGTETSG